MIDIYASRNDLSSLAAKRSATARNTSIRYSASDRQSPAAVNIRRNSGSSSKKLSSTRIYRPSITLA